MSNLGTKITTYLAEFLIGCFIAAMVFFALCASMQPIAFVYQGY